MRDLISIGAKMMSMQALAGKQTLFLLQEMLAEAASKGAAETPLADTLRMRIETAKRWEQRAASFLADAENEKQQLDALDVSAAPYWCCTPAIA